MHNEDPTKLQLFSLDRCCKIPYSKAILKFTFDAISKKAYKLASEKVHM